MSGAHLYNRVDLDDGLMVTIKPITVKHQPGFLLTLTDLDSRMECGKRIFPTFESAHQYAESCFAPSEDADHA